MHVVFDESDNYMPKPVSDDLECDDLGTVLHKNDMINIDANDSHAVKEPVVSAELPKEQKTPMLNLVMFNVLKNPNPLKDVEASALLDVAVLV